VPITSVLLLSLFTSDKSLYQQAVRVVKANKRQNETKAKKNDDTPVGKKDRVKASDAPDKNPDKASIKSPLNCCACASVICDDLRAVNCDKCGKVWKCASCIGIRTSTYDDVVTKACKEFCWFCEPCHDEVMNPAGTEKVMQLLLNLTQQMSVLQEKVDNKVETNRVDTLENMVSQLEQKISDGYNGVLRTLEKSSSEVAAVVQESKLDVTAVQGCVEGILKVQSREDKAEEQEKAKRKSNVIIHGLPEPQAPDASDKKQEDCDAVQDLLHRIACDNVSVTSFTRLGPPRTEADAQPRPILADMASEDAKDRVLKNAKNLKGWKDGFWKSVFIHQDLTPKEREVRRKLVEELKMRRAAGEANLIITNGKIVVKRSSEY